MRIAVDAMGGDFAPNAVVAGAYQAASEDGIPILLVGDRPTLERQLTKQGGHQPAIEVVHSEEVVGMEEPPITPLRKKKRSSIRICGELVKEGRAQAMVSAGNTGASLIVAKTVIGSIKGVDRPALATVFPSPRGGT
ncbi:MAG: phosphate--acyl-ACP acyltransferase, partial [Thermoanaerobaculia bacterium]